MMEFSNPFLRGASTQNRCLVCNRMLANGKCLEGCESKPPGDICNPRTEPKDITIAAPRPATLDAPVFSEAQRQDAAESVTRRIKLEAEQAGEPPTWEHAPSESSNCSDASARAQRKRRAPGDDVSMMHSQLSGARDAAVPKRRPGRPRLSRPDGTTMTPVQAKHNKATATQPEICAITHEPVNIDALKNLASRREAGCRRLPGSNMTVREMIFYFLECCSRRETYENGLEAGVFTVVWRESQCEQELGVKTRRYSGFEPFISVEGAGGGLRGRFLALLRKGVPACFLGRSFFAVSRLLRWTARTEIPGVDIDQVNSHFVA